MLPAIALAAAVLAAAPTQDVDVLAPDCGGANACFVASFTAQRGGRPFGTSRVGLRGGRTGRFTPLGCGASCSPPQIQWKQGTTVYTIQARVGTQPTERRMLIRMADSAIFHRPR